MQPRPAMPGTADILPFPGKLQTGFSNGSRDRESLPVVDIAGLNDRNPAVQRRTAARIGEIAMANGFLYLRNHSVDPSLIEAVYEHAGHFFSGNNSSKQRYYIGNSPNHRGYVPVSEKGDYADEGTRRYEAFDMGLDLDRGDPDFLSGNPLLGPNVWPDQPGFKYVLNQYYNEMARISRLMFRAFEMVLDLEPGFFAARTQKPISQLRLLHYLENQTSNNDRSVNMGAHTDYECFTILHSRTPSLQILDASSRWIDAPPVDNTFYFNIGDMLENWSGGLFVATAHRVVNHGMERFSLPYFAATDYNTPVYTIDCRKYRDRQRVYSPLIAGEHLLSQLLRDFPYLRRRYEEGNLVGSARPGENPFERRIHEAIAS